MDKIELQASNIKCGGCVANVENGLKPLTGVSTISVDVASNIVIVEGTDLNQEAIEAKLAELGYPVQ